MKTLIVCPSCEKLNRLASEKTTSSKPICGNCKTELPLHDGIQDVNGAGLAKLVRSANVPVVVDFWAEWCGPCKIFSPTFKSAAHELAGQMIFAKLNTELHSASAQTFQIRGIPTLIVFKNGVEVDRQSGAMPLPMLIEYLARWK